MSNRNALARCLESLCGQTEQEGVELIVVWEGASTYGGTVHCSFNPAVKWIEAPGTTVPQKRALGIENSSSEIVALTEDDCVMPADWCQSVMAAHQQSSDIAIGGAVQPGEYKKGLDWGIFFCEYGRYMPPFQGAVGALPGNNVSYKRSQLQSLLRDKLRQDGFFEVFVHWALTQAGQTLKADPNILVRNENCWRLENATNVPFHHGRGFAGMRFSGRSVWMRLPYLGVSLLLPWLQTFRIAKQVLSRKGYGQRLAQAMPGIILFWTSWSAGEFVGYLLGPGRSLQQWR